MSVTVADLLELPSLRGARLAAGRGGLNKLVSSISVLEYADPNVLQDELFRNNEFYGSEIVITGFMNIPGMWRPNGPTFAGWQRRGRWG